MVDIPMTDATFTPAEPAPAPTATHAHAFGAYNCVTADHPVSWSIDSEASSTGDTENSTARTVFTLIVKSSPHDRKLRKYAKTTHVSLVDALLRLAEHIKEGQSTNLNISIGT